MIDKNLNFVSFRFALFTEWYKRAKDTNIVYIFHAFKRKIGGNWDFLTGLQELYDSGRFDFTARIGLEVARIALHSDDEKERKRNIEEMLKAFGWSAGSQISATFCRLVEEIMGFKPGLLVGEYIYICMLKLIQ